MDVVTPAPRPHRVLLTNDDGITAPGLIAMITHVPFLISDFRSLKLIVSFFLLGDQLLKRGVYDLRVAAPSKQQSGVSHSITLWYFSLLS